MSLSGWNSHNKLKLVIDHSKVDEDLINFPILLVLSSGTGITNSDVTKIFDELSTVSGSKKIAVATKLDVQCPVEIERWDWANEEGYLWTKVPTISSGTDTELYLYYDSTHDDNEYELGNLCIHSNGPDGSIDIIDSSIKTHSITVHGSAHHEVDQHKFGSSSIYFDGSGDYLSLSSNSDWNFGTGDFTVDFWMYPINGGIGNNYPRLLQLGPNTTNGGLWIVGQTTSPNKIMVQGYSSGYFTLFNSGDALPNNTWTHVALVRKNGIFYLFIGGVLKATNNSHTTYNIIQNAVYIGSNNSGSESYYGYLDEYRISKGIARWTSGFTPPTSQYKMGYVGYTGELIAQQVWDNNFLGVWHMSQDPTGGTGCVLDSTGNANNGTPHGSMTSGDLVDGLIGKALDFDGSNDYIEFSTSLAATSAVTAEALVETSSSTSMFTVDKYNGGVRGFYLSGNKTGASIGGRDGSGSFRSSATVGTYDFSAGGYIVGTIDKNLWKIYANGTLDNSTDTGYTSTNLTTSTHLNIGYFGTDNDKYFDGVIDEVRISNIARSDAWLKATYYSNFDNLIYFDVFSGYFSGTVSEFSTSISGAVIYVYNQTDGSFVGSTTSSGDGGFYIETTYSGAHFLVCVDPYGNETYNNLIYGSMYPATISG